MLRQVRVKNGELRGLPGTNTRISVFKGIPFAAPPVGENRWRAPQPCPDWEGVRTAFEYGPISIQDQPGVGTDIYCREWHVDPDIKRRPRTGDKAIDKLLDEEERAISEMRRAFT